MTLIDRLCAIDPTATARSFTHADFTARGPLLQPGKFQWVNALEYISASG